jgi:glutaredoxin
MTCQRSLNPGSTEGLSPVLPLNRLVWFSFCGAQHLWHGKPATGSFLAIVVLLLFSPLSAALAPQPGNASAQDSCMTLHVYVRQGCPHCAEAKRYLSALQQRYPELAITFYDVMRDAAARDLFLSLSAEHQVAPPGVPAFLQCGDFFVGFALDGSTAARIEAHLTGVTNSPATHEVTTAFGKLSAHELGLPMFTLALGLIDGFNPCAMWVLLFLLSILVNIKDRRRILLIAGTFVIVSGLVYFAFMAAWLNLFLLIGIARWVQVLLGLVAIAMGAVHLKDFVAPQRGISLSIAADKKPGLYARVRDVMYARRLGAALLAITALAITVNVVELLCTAGIPALYTQILSQYGLSTAQ